MRFPYISFELQVRTLLIAFLTVCSVLSSPNASANETSLTFLRPDAGQDSQNILIIFVHGITSNNEDAWKHPQGALPWPELVRNDKAFETADIALFGYSSSYFSQGQGSIDEIADQLVGRLEVGPLETYDQIIFVAHSMGGLVTRAAVSKLENQTNTPFIFFLATPTAGSELANYARRIRFRGEALNGLRELNDNLYLQGEISDWESFNQRHNIASHCFFERVDTFGFRVVEQESATRLCNQKSFPIFENHSRIAKPRDERSLVHERLRFVFRTQYETSLMDFGPNKTLGLDSSSEPVRGALFAENITLTENVIFPNRLLLVANTVDLNGHSLTAPEISIVARELIDGVLNTSGIDGDTQSSMNGNPAGKIVVGAELIAGVRFIAEGGKGLAGAAGENGRDGSPGVHGRRGNCDGFGRWRPPQSGSAGEDGQDGAPGQDGGQGGDGGEVFIITKSEPEIFSMIVSGGDGGRGGRGGQGGRGGAGGNGGRGCVGLGGSSTNASNGSPGLDGLTGPDGRNGERGVDGRAFVAQAKSFDDVRALLPSIQELPDYGEAIQAQLQQIVTRP